VAYDVVYIDHGNIGSAKNYVLLKNKVPHAFKLNDRPIKTSKVWYVSSYTDINNFDFTWTPHIYKKNFNHCAKNQYGYSDSGLTLINKNSVLSNNLNIDDTFKITRTSKNHEIFYVDTGSHKNYIKQLQLNHNVKTTRFFDSWQKVAKRCANKMESEYCWIVPSDVQVDSIDFSWFPNFWETNFLHIFKSKWQKNSGVMFVHRDWLKDTTQYKYRQDFIVQGDKDAYDKFFLDFFDDNSKLSEKSFNVGATKIRFFDNHLDTIKRLTSKATTKYFWVLSGNCKYEEFDFSWLPDEKTYDHLHTFPSDDQPYGDTFFVDKHSFDIKSKNLKNFKHYETINFNKQQKVRRCLYDFLGIGHYDFAKAIKDHYQRTPTKYFWIVNMKAKAVPRDEFQYDFSPDYWSPPTIYTFGDDNDIMLIPKDAGPHIIEQVYDYPHIKKLDIQATERTLMDVIFISYDEPNAEKHWKMLKEKCPRAKRVQNIKGQTEAYHTAAKLSKTEWFYAVFAKHEPVESFNYDWQPNRLKAPCHYIFYGVNEINKLEYGHSGVILYERNLVLATIDPGLDFTLSAKHDVVPIVSAINRFAYTPLMAWRTAFRECIKLKYDIDTTNNIEQKYRLKIWCTVGKGKNAEWCIKGANDAVEYMDSVKSRLEDLKKSYNFEWLIKYFKDKYGEVND
jgi:hypothetical protein